MNTLKYIAVILLLASLWGCGKGNSSAAPVIDTTTGKHAAGWVDLGAGGLHSSVYFNNREACKECHGKDMKGGISKVSCSPGSNNLGCHPVFPHANDFDSPSAHGKYATGMFTGIGIMGIAHCKKCHGFDFKGGLDGAYWDGPNCIKCHQERGSNPTTNAPHGANWSAFVGRHSKTHSSNVPACFQCHANGQYSHKPPQPAPPGTEPGCFNGTMCHNAPLAHAVPFIAPTDHGTAIKKTYDWAYCANCHATADSNEVPRYNAPKGNMTNGCETCHSKPYLAHPQMWLPGRGTGTPTTYGGTDVAKNTSHVDVPPSQVITSCTMCHGITAASVNPVVPSCATAGGKTIDGIRCHFTSPVDDKGQTVGCISCHSFTSASTPVFSSTYPTRDYKHTVHIPWITTAWSGLSPACYACHSSLGSGATHADGTGNVTLLAQFGGSYNQNTSTCSSVNCHMGKQTPPWTATGSVGCIACHDTASGAPIDTTHQKHLISGATCDACHYGAGYGTPNHGKGVVIVSLNPIYGASATYNSTTKTCSNVSCHGGKQTPPWGAANAGCTACHDNPDGSPNSGRHQKHVNGVELKVPCASCHYGAGSGTPLHANGTVNIDVSPLFDANGVPGEATYNLPTATSNAEKCTNLSCHGAGGGSTVLATTPFPKWTATTIFNSNCTSTCHRVSAVAQPAAGVIPTPYYMGPFGGNNDAPDTSGGDVTARPFGPGVGNNLHQVHLSFANNCLNCHNITGRHFAKLNQGLGRRRIPAGEAADTVRGIGITSYDPATSSCVATCHSNRAQLWYK